MTYTGLSNSRWSESDFDQMGWHDNKMYGIAFGISMYEIMFDIDYILQWISPEEGKGNYEFLVVPVTLVFRNVYDLVVDFNMVEAVIDTIFRDNPVRPRNASHIGEQLEYDWTIQTTNGTVNFKSTGYTQYARQQPRKMDSQTIDIVERGGVSFYIPHT